jgi:hypothetical protein
MSIRVVTATPPARLSILAGPIWQLRRPEHRTKGTVAIVLLAAAALAANIANAAASNQYRRSAVSMPNRSWTSHYAPSDYGRHDYGVSAQSRVPGRGIFSPEVENGGP